VLWRRSRGDDEIAIDDLADHVIGDGVEVLIGSFLFFRLKHLWPPNLKRIQTGIVSLPKHHKTLGRNLFKSYDLGLEVSNREFHADESSGTVLGLDDSKLISCPGNSSRTRLIKLLPALFATRSSTKGATTALKGR
jgi:hypothetical protein